MAPSFTLLLVLGLLILIGIVLYNRLIALKTRVKEGWSDILVQLKRRHDLIGNLVETVKGYAKHEAETLEKVIQARNAAKTLEGSPDLKTIQMSERNLDMALKGINFNALAESYPDLKANTSFNQLQAELADTENKIAASRRFYNSTVSALNAAVQQFPSNLFAGMARATVAEFFEMDEAETKAASEVPKVKF